MSTILAVVAQAAPEESEKINHWLVGGITLGILLALLFALISFGGGRDHS